MITINILVLALILIAEAIIFTIIGMLIIAKKAMKREQILRNWYFRQLCNQGLEES